MNIVNMNRIVPISKQWLIELSPLGSNMYYLVHTSCSGLVAYWNGKELTSTIGPFLHKKCECRVEVPKLIHTLWTMFINKDKIKV